MQTMKLDSISKGWMVPGAKCCVHKDGMTAIVSDNDSVYIYKGGEGEPLRMLAFNPKSRQAVYVDGNESNFLLSTDDIEQSRLQEKRFSNQQAEDLACLYRGRDLLIGFSFLPFPLDDKKIYEWMESLFDRPGVLPQELERGSHLIANISELRAGSHKKMNAMCRMIGEQEYTDFSNNHYYRLERDSDLDFGVSIHVNSPDTSVNRMPETELCAMAFPWQVVRLTREEAQWLRDLLPPFPAQKFVSVHRKMQISTKAEEAKRGERGRMIVRSASHVGGNSGKTGTVII